MRCKSFNKFLYSNFAKIFFSINNITNPFYSSCDMVDLKEVLSIFENFLSVEATITGIVNNIL